MKKTTAFCGETHRPAASHWQTLSHNVVSSRPHLSGIRTHNIRNVRLLGTVSDPDIFIRRSVILLLFFSLKKSDFKTICFKKITKHGKKKSDKDIFCDNLSKNYLNFIFYAWSLEVWIFWISCDMGKIAILTLVNFLRPCNSW
jgi:hypothetical protein